LFHVLALVASVLLLAGCGGDAPSPSPVPHVVSNTVATQFGIATQTHRVSACPFQTGDSMRVPPQLTCFVPASCAAGQKLGA